MSFRYRVLQGVILAALGLGGVVFFAAAGFAAQEEGLGSSKKPVDFQADNLYHDQARKIITASGQVIMKQDGRTVEADEVVYNMAQDTVTASGHVVYTDVQGNKHKADQVTFHDAMKTGFVTGLKSFLVDGAKFKAAKGEHNPKGTVMQSASYTPCESCEGEEPLWQIKASEVAHDKENKSISYKNARFEVMGVPVAYTPYFSHPDGTVKRKNGFLTPSGGYKSDLGAFVESGYYWSLAPEKDLTIGARVMTKEAPLMTGEWRQRWDDADLKVNTTATYSRRNDEREGEKIVRSEEFRGSVGADGLWDINSKWRGGLDLNLVTDRQYLRQYDLDNEADVLENQLYLERFSGRDYFSARALSFQDLRVEEDREDQPNILPEIEANFMGDPNSVPIIGGRWSATASMLGLARNNDGQDMGRLGTGLGWSRRLVSDYGLVSVLDADVRGEMYQVNDLVQAQSDPSIDNDSFESRGFGSFSALSSYPIAKPIQNARVVIEPLVGLTVAPDIDNNDRIPNEDSEDVQLDAANLFESNRFAGLDRVEDLSHATYGVKTGVYADDGSYGDAFIGQSYRFSDDDNPFAVGSGLETQKSDIVGQISGGIKDDYRLHYRFQLDNDDMSSQRHEVDASLRVLQNLDLSTRYLFAKGLQGTEITQTREQIENGASYKIDEQWRVFGSARHDLGEDKGMREANAGLDFSGQCFSWSVTGTRNLTSDVSGDSGTEIMMRIGLKNLGEFETSGLNVQNNKDKEKNK